MSEPNTSDVKTLTRALSIPFDPSMVRFKPAVVQGNRALALAYVDARAIQDRLDEVLGVEGWQDDYEILADGSVVCRLRLRLGNEWVTKVDVGGPSDQPDGGDRLKAAFSDALKRAAVKFGIGRYLYRLPSQWVDYDPARRQFLQTPQLPTFARPVKEASNKLPANGAELRKRLEAYDAKLAGEGRCASGALVKHVVDAGVKAGYGPDLNAWTGAAITLAAVETRTFEKKLPSVRKRDAA